MTWTGLAENIGAIVAQYDVGGRSGWWLLRQRPTMTSTPSGVSFCGWGSSVTNTKLPVRYCLETLRAIRHSGMVTRGGLDFYSLWQDSALGLSRYRKVLANGRCGFHQFVPCKTRCLFHCYSPTRISCLKT